MFIAYFTPLANGGESEVWVRQTSINVSRRQTLDGDEEEEEEEVKLIPFLFVLFEKKLRDETVDFFRSSRSE